MTYTTLGVQTATTVTLTRGWIGSVRATVGWGHAFGDVLPLSTLAAGVSSTFVIAGVAIPEDALIVDAGLDVHIDPQIAFSISYNGQTSRIAADKGFRAQLSRQF